MQAGAAAAVEARDDAASWASESGAGAAASQAAKLEAQAARDGAQSAAVATLPSRPAQVEFFTSTLVGRPENTGPVTGPGVSIETNAAEGDVLRTTGVARHVNAKGWVAIGEGRTHRVTARVRLVADGALPTKVQVGIRRTNAAADNNGGQYVTQTMSVAAGWQTITWEGSSASIRSGQPTATHFRPGSHLGSETGSSAASGGTVEIASLVYEDVTSEVAAKLEASASAASASSAAASDTEAGQKAAAAHEDMLAAQTARGGAQAAETGAVNARDDAEGHASTAASQAGLSAQYRDQSQQAAQASNDAAAIAAIKADEAGASAQAANAQKLAAEAARDTADQKAQASVLAAAQAEAFAGDAGDWAAASEGAAVQAAARAAEGLAYRNQAVDARDGAVAANVASGTSAQAALAAVRDSGVIPPFTSKSNIQRYWSHQFAGASETLADLLDANIENVAEGWALKINESTDFLRPKWALTPVAGQKVRVTVKCRKPSAAANSLQIITRGQSAAGAAIGANVTTSVALAGTNSQTVSAVMDMDTWVAQGAASVMFRFSSAAAGVIYVTAAQIEDVTAEQAAQAHAATALTQASSAGASAADARLQANLAAQVGGHGRRISDGSLFTASLGGSPASVADLTVGTVVQDASEGASRSYTEAVNIQTKAVYEIGSGRTFRVYSRARVMTNGADNTTFAHFRVLDASYANLGPVGSSFAQGAADGWKTFVHEMTSEQIKAAFPTAFYIRGAVRMNRAGTTTGSSGATTRVSELWMEDASELAPVSAQLAITAAVAADAADRVGSVRFDVTGGADGDPFQIWGRAGPDGSVAGMVASELSFSTVVRGLVVKAMRLIGGDVFVINRLYVGPNKEIEIEPFTPAINWTMGSARLAIGKLANDNLLFWFGPNVTAANMRKSNAALWLDRAGGAYFGGALSAGTLTSKAATTSLSFGATTETARFNSNGGSITVTLSLSGGWSKGYWNPSSLPAATENGNVVVTLYRSVNGGAFSPVVTLPMTYNWSRETREYEPGLGWHIVEQGAYAGSLTYTDPQTSTQDRQYRATITTFSPVTQTGIMTSQNLSIIAVE
ncbi:hypothetical protein [Brevundimonas diminuta]|uniref:hypothetical protein n=1 Tax=Brevundimonas diminuta TaxID=293 RepID=UPI003D9A99C5